jgi:hypothetical protein
MTEGFEPLHATLTLTRRPVRILAPVIEVATLAMFHARENLSLYPTWRLALNQSL